VVGRIIIDDLVEMSVDKTALCDHIQLFASGSRSWAYFEGSKLSIFEVLREFYHGSPSESKVLFAGMGNPTTRLVDPDQLSAFLELFFGNSHAPNVHCGVNSKQAVQRVRLAMK
jgi:hypothetical protein